jgi:hypothetical protein
MVGKTGIAAVFTLTAGVYGVGGGENQGVGLGILPAVFYNIVDDLFTGKGV